MAHGVEQYSANCSNGTDTERILVQINVRMTLILQSSVLLIYNEAIKLAQITFHSTLFV